jgi:parvulin-like peptidyl-prolyl isomerase
LGATIFIVFNVVTVVTKDESERPDKIVVTAGQIQHLAETFTRTWQRPPTSQELNGLVQDYIREEVLYREAIALALDSDDTIIRRRLRQKMEFISEDIAAQTEPTEEELRDYLLKNPEKFHSEPIFTFRQIYLNADRRANSLTSDIENLLAELNNSGTKSDISRMGDPLLLENDLNAVRESEVSKLFGEKFAEQLTQLELGKWRGPVKSGYGVHLVFIEERREGRVPQLSEVRDAVQREWANDLRLEMNEKFYQGLLERYTIVIDQPENSSGAAAAEKEAGQ